ncbi:cell wall-associated NlpC family hydrolase [Actinocorallia herbida]|uniref:Cell wall-associated NlpC family hydrolase n=1 Tax=Actinocorallia herbida TaxID=58109 RepID=A0A3N1CR91_9ACTN|nr:C40 family peptidase [Actinocorallia herbida]ROO83837.1 cell wall-associated NlpC family hydrolase [Actinocorallia herbida]
MRLASGLLATSVLAPGALIAVPAQAAAVEATTTEQKATKKKKKTWAQRKKIAQKALAWAKKKKGKPYVYGAAGPNSFDCSGLVGYVYRKAGVKLPRTTTSIYAHFGRKIKWKDLYPGDLVFFYGGRSHVGIVSKVSGNKVWMIHSPRTGDHVRQVLLDSYRKQNFNGAVRPY